MALPSPAVASKALSLTAAGLVADLPLLMHGSGDVTPNGVDAESVSILAELTADYISDLVSAAVDAHEMLTDGSGVIAHPAPSRTKKIPRSDDYWDGSDDAESDPWMGVVGADLRADRGRPQGSAIGTKSFIFPICHDAAQYGRVKEVQAARRRTAPIMMDQVILDAMEEEAGEGVEWPCNETLPIHK